MKFVAVDELPKMGRGGKPYTRHKTTNQSIRKRFEEFVAMDVKYARVDRWDTEYQSSRTVTAVFSKAAKYHSDLPVAVRVRKGEIYLVRTDM